ncbi:hypothetical protein [Paenibacillus sp. NPDC057967]|uniref:hypothetical protein n=1 Tax=Paenibacillus sp. NPDC057967 TaxID=3346293 RepID=UPI0036DC7311
MKSERIYLRTTPEHKEYLQEVADNHFEGNMSAVFEFMIERLEMIISKVKGKRENAHMVNELLSGGLK